MFSLRELMDIEQGRVADDRAKEEQARVEAQRAKMEAELRIAAADEARRRADAERQRVEEATRREEATRLEAMRLAIIEKARIEALDKARLETLKLEHAQQAELLKVKAVAERSSLRKMIAGAVFFAAAVGAASIGYYVGVVVPRQEAAAIELEQKNAKIETERAEKERALDALEVESANLRDQRNNLPPVATSVPAPPVTATPTTPRTKPTVKPTATAVPTSTGPCNKLDPMSECLR